MGYFKNKAINLLNTHFFFYGIGFSVGFTFGPLYLYKIGIPIPTIFLLLGAAYLCRIPFREFSRYMAFKIGLKPLVLLGLFAMALSYWFLMQTQAINAWYWAYFFTYAFGSCTYWLNYHVLYAKMGDHEHRGKQVSIRMLLDTFAGVISPLLNGFLIYSFSFKSSFYTGIAFILISTIFVLKLPHNPIPEKRALKSITPSINWSGFKLFFTSGISNPAQTTVWQLILFIFLGNTLSLGGLLAYSIMLKTIAQLLLGQRIDKGKGLKWCDIGFGGNFLNTLAKALFGIPLPVILGLEISESLTGTLRTASDTVFFYNEGKKSHHPFYYQYLAETGWDLGSGSMLLLCGILTSLDVELRTLMLLGSFGILLSWYVVRPYYSDTSQTSPSQCI